MRSLTKESLKDKRAPRLLKMGINSWLGAVLAWREVMVMDTVDLLLMLAPKEQRQKLRQGSIVKEV